MRDIHFLSRMYFSAKTEQQFLCAAVRYLPHEKENTVPMDEWRAVLKLISRQTPRKFVNLFPIRKEYDGLRFQSKDYFTTCLMIELHGWDTPIGDAISFLWDYVNPHTSSFLSAFFCAVDGQRRQENLPGLLESFAKSSGIDLRGFRPVTMNGKQYMQSTSDSTIIPISHPKPQVPRWWKIIEGGKKDENRV